MLKRLVFLLLVCSPLLSPAALKDKDREKYNQSGAIVLTKDGDKWELKTTARTSSGKKVSGTNVLTKTDDDHFSWQLTKLTVDGEVQPDPKPVKMKRVKPVQR